MAPNNQYQRILDAKILSLQQIQTEIQSWRLEKTCETTRNILSEAFSERRHFKEEKEILLNKIHILKNRFHKLKENVWNKYEEEKNKTLQLEGNEKDVVLQDLYSKFREKKRVLNEDFKQQRDKITKKIQEVELLEDEFFKKLSFIAEKVNISSTEEMNSLKRREIILRLINCLNNHKDLLILNGSELEIFHSIFKIVCPYHGGVSSELRFLITKEKNCFCEFGKNCNEFPINVPLGVKPINIDLELAKILLNSLPNHHPFAKVKTAFYRQLACKNDSKKFIITKFQENLVLTKCSRFLLHDIVQKAFQESLSKLSFEYIPFSSNHIGKLIGKGGRNIKDLNLFIQQQFNKQQQEQQQIKKTKNINNSVRWSTVRVISNGIHVFGFDKTCVEIGIKCINFYLQRQKERNTISQHDHLSFPFNHENHEYTFNKDQRSKKISFDKKYKKKYSSHFEKKELTPILSTIKICQMLDKEEDNSELLWRREGNRLFPIYGLEQSEFTIRLLKNQLYSNDSLNNNKKKNNNNNKNEESNENNNNDDNNNNNKNEEMKKKKKKKMHLNKEKHQKRTKKRQNKNINSFWNNVFVEGIPITFNDNHELENERERIESFQIYKRNQIEKFKDKKYATNVMAYKMKRSSKSGKAQRSPFLCDEHN